MGRRPQGRRPGPCTPGLGLARCGSPVWTQEPRGWGRSSTSLAVRQRHGTCCGSAQARAVQGAELTTNRSRPQPHRELSRVQKNRPATSEQTEMLPVSPGGSAGPGIDSGSVVLQSGWGEPQGPHEVGEALTPTRD